MISRGETVVNRGETGWPLQMIFLDVLYGKDTCYTTYHLVFTQIHRGKRASRILTRGGTFVLEDVRVCMDAHTCVR